MRMYSRAKLRLIAAKSCPRAKKLKLGTNGPAKSAHPSYVWTPVALLRSRGKDTSARRFKAICFLIFTLSRQDTTDEDSLLTRF